MNGHYQDDTQCSSTRSLGARLETWAIDCFGTRNLSNPEIACKIRALDFEMFHYICMRARFMNGIQDIVHQNRTL